VLKITIIKLCTPNFAKIFEVKKGTKLYAILGQKCPHCHEGNLFINRNPYVLNKIWEMPNSCSVCGQIYQLEPSFFYGAMYVNYGLTVAIGVAVFVGMSLLGDEWSLEAYLIGIIGSIILAAPITFRLGRAIWINMFISYDPKAIDQADSRTQ
jgi:uncharacterized protein (DUF983 family)